MDPRDKYGMKTLQVGEEIKVMGADPSQFHHYVY